MKNSFLVIFCLAIAIFLYGCSQVRESSLNLIDDDNGQLTIIYKIEKVKYEGGFMATHSNRNVLGEKIKSYKLNIVDRTIAKLPEHPNLGNEEFYYDGAVVYLEQIRHPLENFYYPILYDDKTKSKICEFPKISRSLNNRYWLYLLSEFSWGILDLKTGQMAQAKTSPRFEVRKKYIGIDTLFLNCSGIKVSNDGKYIMRCGYINNIAELYSVSEDKYASVSLNEMPIDVSIIPFNRVLCEGKNNEYIIKDFSGVELEKFKLPGKFLCVDSNGRFCMNNFIYNNEKL